MGDKNQEGKQSEDRKSKSVRFSSNISIKNASPQKNEDDEDFPDTETQTDDSFTNSDWEEYTRLKAEKEELEDVLYDFYHDSKMEKKPERVLVGEIDSDPSESTSSLICRVLVHYEKLCEEKRILEEEKSKLDEDKLQLCSSMAKLREQLHDAVDSNIEEIEDLNRENEELRYKINEKASNVKSSFLKYHEDVISNMKLSVEFSKTSSLAKVIERLKKDLLLAEKQLEDAKSTPNAALEEKDAKVKRTKSLPSSLRQPNAETLQRGGLLRELKTCKDLQESQRKQIQKILEEKLDLEVKLSEIKRHNVKLKAERRSNIKTKSKHVQTGGSEQFSGLKMEGTDQVDGLANRCKDLEAKLNMAKSEKLTVEDEKTSLLMSLDANVEKTHALEEQLAALQMKLNGVQKDLKKPVPTKSFSVQTDAVKSALTETDGGLRGSYKKGLSDVKVGIEKIRVQEQDKQIALLKRENDAVREKLKKSEAMLQTLQNCLKELTDEKHDLLDSVEELNEEKAELEKSRLKLEKELGGAKREKFVADEVSDIRKKERKLVGDIETSKAKLAQLDLKVVEVLSLFGNADVVNKPKTDSREDVEAMISSVLSSVESLKRTVSDFKMAYDQSKGESLQMKTELQAIGTEKNQLQNKVEELNKKIKNVTASLESSSKSRTSYETRISKELEKMRDAKTALEKSFSVGRKREDELERQLKDSRAKRDTLQKSCDKLTNQSGNSTTRLAVLNKEVEEARITNEKMAKEVEEARVMNEKLTKDVGELREDLEGTVEDRDELLELLDRIVCENGTGEDRRSSLGLKVERIREKSRSQENLLDDSDSKPQKAIDEKYLMSSQATVELSSAPEDEVFATSGTSAKHLKTDGNKRTSDLVEENQRLKEMIEKILDDQKNMEVALSSFSEANAEIQQDLTESIKQTEQIRSKSWKSSRNGKDVVDYVSSSKAAPKVVKKSETDTENAELQKLHEAMVSTNDALSTHIRRLQGEKTRREQLKSSWEDVTKQKADLEKKVKSLTKEKSKIGKEVDALEGKCRQYEKESAKTNKEKDELQTMLDESKTRMKDLKEHMDSLTEINKDLRETNERVTKSSKEAENRMLKMNREFSEAETGGKALESMNKRLQKEVTELTQKQVSAELELEQSKGSVSDLKSKIASHSKKADELQSTVDANEEELKILRSTATKLSGLEEKVGSIGKLQSENETLKKAIAEDETRSQETEAQLAKLKKDIENSQRYIKVVSQENDNLRDALADWEREASKIRQHMLHGNRSPSVPKKELAAAEDSGKSVSTLEAMQIEIDAVNKHMKALRSENKELTANLEAMTKENDATKDKNIELLTKYDVMSKEIEKMDAEISSLRKDLKNASVYDQEKSMLQASYEKLEQENSVLRGSLGVTLDEERALGDRLKKLMIAPPIKDGKRLKKSKSKNTINEDQLIIKSEVDGLAASKPDLIQHSKEVKEQSAVEEAKLKNEYFGLEKGGERHDVHDLIKGVSNERASLKTLCEEVAKVFHDVNARDVELQKHLDEASDKKGKKKDVKGNKAAVEKATQAKLELEAELKKKESEVTQLTEEKTKLENEANVVKEKSDKLQAVFRALVAAMDDTKSANDGPTSLVDRIKNIKTRYTALVAEKETLEQKVKKLEKEIKDVEAKEQEKAKMESEKKSESRKSISSSKETLEEKERMLNELLLTSARDKRHFVEKLQEVYEEFDRVKTDLGTELKKQRKASVSVPVLEKVYQEFEESVTHTETFVQSVVHERRVTVVADAASDKDANLELAKENEELIGRINAIKSSRRRETKALKEEIANVTEEKEDAIKELECKYTAEIESLKEQCKKTTKEKEDTIAELKDSWAKEVEQLNKDIARITEAGEKAHESLKKESREAIRRLEEQVKTLRQNVDKVVAEKKSSELQLGELKRKHAAETKEMERATESEISHVRANWADAERKVRALSEEKETVGSELHRMKLEKSEQSSKSAREIQKLKTSVDTVQKEALAREDDFNRERDKLQQTINLLEQSFKKTEMSGLERTQNRIGDFQRHLSELAQQNKQLENAKMVSEANLNAELERVRRENMRLQGELQVHQGQRRVVMNTNEQPRRTEQHQERVKVLTAVKQQATDKPKVASPVESAPQFDKPRMISPVEKQQPPVPAEKPRRSAPLENVPTTLPIEKTRVSSNLESRAPPVPAAKPKRPTRLDNVPTAVTFEKTRVVSPLERIPPPSDKPRWPSPLENVPTSLPYEQSRLISPLESAGPPPPSDKPRRPSPTETYGQFDKPKLASPVENTPYHIDPQRRVKVRQSQTAVVHKSRVQDSNVRRPSGEHNDTICEELDAMFRPFHDEWPDHTTTTSAVILARPLQKENNTETYEVQPQKPQPEWEPDIQERPSRPASQEPRRPPVSRQQETPSPTITGRMISRPYPQKVGYVQDDSSNRHPSTSHTRQNPSHKQDAPMAKIPSVENLERQPREVRRVQNDKTVKNKRHRHIKGPSVGSDEVFVTENALLSQAAKNSDFYRSRSLDNLVDIGDDDMKGKHKAQKSKTKLPKSYSGPRKLESSPWDGNRGASSRNDSDKKVQKVTPLKGMEYVIFQHQV